MLTKMVILVLLGVLSSSMAMNVHSEPSDVILSGSADAAVPASDRFTCEALLLQFLTLNRLDDHSVSSALAAYELEQATTQNLNEDADACIRFLTKLIVRLEEFKYLRPSEFNAANSDVEVSSSEYVPRRDTRRVKVKGFWKKRAANRKFW